MDDEFTDIYYRGKSVSGSISSLEMLGSLDPG
jgi:hypothetical protein